MSAKELKPRLLPSWIAGFLDYSDDAATPEIFRLWAGIAGISAALERRCWITTVSGKIFPNLFILLTSPPGVGKDQAIGRIRDILAAVNAIRLSPISMTGKGLVDTLAEGSGSRTMTINGMPELYSPLTIIIPELGTLLASYDNTLLSIINELYNCNPVFNEKIRSKDYIHIENPHICILAGTQPKYLASILPEEAFGMGTTARINFIYAGKAVKKSLFTGGGQSSTSRDSLVRDLKQIADLKGDFTVSREAAAALEDWHLHGSEADAPTHVKLQSYNTRRILHIAKLMMVSCAARTNTMHIEEEDFHWSLQVLLDSEAVMPQIFKEMASGGQRSEIEEAFYHVLTIHNRTKKPVSESSLVHFLSARVPANQVDYLINTMIRSRMIEEAEDVVTIAGRNQFRKFKPVALNASEDL